MCCVLILSVAVVSIMLRCGCRNNSVKGTLFFTTFSLLAEGLIAVADGLNHFYRLLSAYAVG